jgi:type VI secretion system secreted protein Hcp
MTTFNLQASSVNGWFEDIFGGSKSTEEIKSDSGFAIFADFDAISGESTDTHHANWIDIISLNFSMGVPGGATVSTRRRGDVVINDIVLTKRIDKSTPKLMESVAMGRVIAEVVIEITKEFGDRKTFYKYELTNVMVTSYQSSAGTGNTAPTDILTLNFEEIRVTYTEYDSSGSSKGNVEWSYRIEEGET